MTEDLNQIKLKSGVLWKWSKRILKTTLILAVICVMAFSVLANIGGASDDIKESLESFLAELTGYEAQIETLNSVNFFPVIIFDFEGLELFEKPKEDDALSAPIITADKIYIARSFWDYAFQNNKIRSIAVKNFIAAPGAVFEKSFTLDDLNVQRTEEKTAILMGRGTINHEAFFIETPLEISGTPPKQSYRFTETQPIQLKKQDGTRIPITFQNGMLTLDTQAP